MDYFEGVFGKDISCVIWTKCCIKLYHAMLYIFLPENRVIEDTPSQLWKNPLIFFVCFLKLSLISTNANDTRANVFIQEILN